jgi:hypothetical protein
LAIVDPHFYATLDEQVRRHDRSHIKGILSSRKTRLVRQYLDRIKQKGRHDCYRHFDLPPELSCITDLADVLERAPILDCCTHPFPKFEAFIFRDRWAVFRRYHTDLSDLRDGLRTHKDPLQQAGPQPFPEAR